MIKITSVVIPTYNGTRTIERCIKSVLEQSLKPYEIIVVNNGSTDATMEMLKTFPKICKRLSINFKVVNEKNNVGVAGGRNIGIKNVFQHSKYILFLDHDMYAEPTMLRELIKTFELKKDIGIVTPKIYYWKDKNKIWSAGTGINLWTGQIIFRGGDDFGQFY